MQPTKDKEQYKQLSLDLGIDEETYKEIEKKDLNKKIRHRYDNTISLEELKNNITNSLNTRGINLLLKPPLLCYSKNLVIWDKNKGGIFRDDNNSITFNNFTYLDRTNESYIKEIQEREPSFRYVINYFYNDPKETPEEKKEIIQNLFEFRHPKKWIYDTITNEETITEPTLIELATCLYFRPYLTNEAYWELVLKPEHKKVFTSDGMKELKKVYDNVKASTGSYLTRSIEEDAIRELNNYNQEYYNNPNLKNYIDFLEDKINQLKKTLEQDKDSYKRLLEDTEQYFTKSNITMDMVKNQISLRENLDFNKVYERDHYLLKYYLNLKALEIDLGKNLNELEEDSLVWNSINREEYYYIHNIVNSEPGTLNNYYFKILELGNLKNIINFKETSIRVNTNLLTKAKIPTSREGKINTLLEYLLKPQYFKRHEGHLVEVEETAKGHIAQYSNNIFNNFIDYRVSFKNISKKELPQYEELINQINQAKEKIAQLEKKLKDFTLEPELIDHYRNELDKAKESFKDLEKEKLAKGYITINNEPYKARIPISTKNMKISLGETPNAVELIIDNDFIASYPKTFDIDTLVNKKKDTKPGFIYDLTPDKADKLSSYIRLIIKRASQSYSEGIKFTIEELAKRLDITRKPGAEIRFLTTILKKVEIKNINLKGGKKGSITNSSFIDTFKIDNGEVWIILSPIVREIANLNTSKIWTSNAILSPKEDIIDNKTAQLMNQLIFNSTTGEAILHRDIKPISLIRGVSSFNLDTGANHFKEQVGEELADILISLNNNEETFYLYNEKSIKRLMKASKLDDLEEPMRIEYKNENFIPSKIKHQEENRKAYLLKNPVGTKKRKVNKK